MGALFSRVPKENARLVSLWLRMRGRDSYQFNGDFFVCADVRAYIKFDQNR